MRLAARVVALLIVVVGILDVVSTNASIGAGGAETNALVSALMAQLESWWFLPKIAIHLIVAAVVLWLPSRPLLWKAQLCIAAYTLVIFSNFHIAAWSLT